MIKDFETIEEAEAEAQRLGGRVTIKELFGIRWINITQHAPGCDCTECPELHTNGKFGTCREYRNE